MGSSDSAEWAELLAETKTRFFIQGESTRLEFVTDNGGVVTGLIFEIEEGAELSAPKIE